MHIDCQDQKGAAAMGLWCPTHPKVITWNTAATCQILPQPSVGCHPLKGCSQAFGMHQLTPSIKVLPWKHITHWSIMYPIAPQQTQLCFHCQHQVSGCPEGPDKSASGQCQVTEPPACLYLDIVVNGLDSSSLLASSKVSHLHRVRTKGSPTTIHQKLKPHE